jgi:LacI family transcriptional regulator
MATIYEVAARAGVSPATVSRVMNGTKVSPALERAVRAAAEELAFIPNRTARTLRRQNSQVIALVIPDIENPFWTSVARGVEDRARAAGYSIVLCNTDDDREREATYIEIALSEHASGVVLVPAADDSDLSRLVARRCPVVAVDRSPKGVEVDRAVFDSEGGARRVVEALIAHGYTRIACISGPATVETAALRADGWRVAAKGVGAKRPGYLRHANYRVDGAYAAMTELLALPEPPDAVFVANNIMAVGALEALAEVGLEPPGFGVGVLGDLPYDILSRAGAHVARLPARELGAAAADLLLARIAGDTGALRTVTLEADEVRSPAPVAS